MSSEQHKGGAGGGRLPDLLVYPLAVLLLVIAISVHLSGLNAEREASWAETDDWLQQAPPRQRQSRQDRDAAQEAPPAATGQQLAEEPRIAEVPGEPTPAAEDLPVTDIAVSADDREPYHGSDDIWIWTSGRRQLQWRWLARRSDEPYLLPARGSMSSADLDGDGEQELYIANPQHGLISRLDPVNGVLHRHALLPDLNGINMELCYAWNSPDGSMPRLMLYSARGAFAIMPDGGSRWLEGAVRLLGSFPPRDFDGDGLDDLLCMAEDGSWYELRSPGGRTLLRGPLSREHLGNIPRGYADIDGDGLAELMEWDFAAGRTALLQWGAEPQVLTEHNLRQMKAACDLNGDGREELVFDDGWYDAATDELHKYSGNSDILYGGRFFMLTKEQGRQRFLIALPSRRSGGEELLVYSLEGRELARSRTLGEFQDAAVVRLSGGEIFCVLTTEGVLEMYRN
ncbi:hypothetical protein KDL44_06980 [bacterium]|nr:hypothetical protein [bacterium]